VLSIFICYKYLIIILVLTIMELSEYVDTIIPGELFNSMFSNVKLVRVSNKQLVPGIFRIPFQRNTYTNETYISGGNECCVFGQQVFEKNKYIYSLNNTVYIGDVIVMDDAEVLVKKDCVCINNIELTNVIPMDNMKEWDDEEFCMKIVGIAPDCLKYVRVTRTDEIYKKVIDGGFFHLKDIPNPSDELCKYAMQKSAYAVIHIKNPTQQMCLTAMQMNHNIFTSLPEDKKNYDVYLEFVSNRPYGIKTTPPFFLTHELIEGAVSNDGTQLLEVPRHLLTESICLKAISSLPERYFSIDRMINYIGDNNLTEKICKLIVEKFSSAINILPPTLVTEHNLCETAVKKNPKCIINIKMEYLTNEILLIAVQCDGMVLQHIISRMQTDQLCKEAVKNNGLALEFIINKTPEICELAFENNINAIKFIPCPSFEMCKIANETDPSLIHITSKFYNPSDDNVIELIKKTPHYILKLDNPSELMVIEALKKDGKLIEHIKYEYLTHNARVEAVNHSPFALRFIKAGDQTTQICLAAIRQNAFAMEYVANQTEELCNEAINVNPTSIIKIKNLTEEMCIKAIKLKVTCIYNVPIHLKTFNVCFETIKIQPSIINKLMGLVKDLDIPENMHEEIVSSYGPLIKYIKNPSESLCKIAIKNSVESLQYISPQTEELCEYALNLDPMALQFIKTQTDTYVLTAINKNYRAFGVVTKQDRIICEHASIINPMIIGLIRSAGVKMHCDAFINNLLDKSMKIY